MTIEPSSSWWAVTLDISSSGTCIDMAPFGRRRMVRRASATVRGPGLAMDIGSAVRRREDTAVRSFACSAAVGARRRPVAGSMATVTPA